MSDLNLKTDTRQANWRRQNAEKYRAHLTVQRALKSGELTKQGARSAETSRPMPTMTIMATRLRLDGCAGSITRGCTMVARTCLPAAPPATIDVPVGHAGILARRRDLWRAPGALSHLGPDGVLQARNPGSDRRAFLFH